ncbi:MAG TPA: cysteine desulfurase [Bacteroidales bacterium]|nr:cysteine desulfurase [Bacteroidales bacterium]HOK97910.1 cysteine desulfurase [Bacteroidales bacterium]HPO64486.1 cysteine desulfurase [Bacteroidales bacterium]
MDTRTYTVDFDVQHIRKDFPILHQIVHGYPLAYFDNAATTQKPQCVIDTIVNYYTHLNSNIHRGVHYLSEQSTNLYEEARKTVQQFINAQYSQEVIFTSGTTAAINAVAFSFGERFVKEGDEIVISAMEHHANIVPWQMMCERKGARLKVIPIDNKGEILFDEYLKLLTPKVKLVAVTHVSNVLGTINPIEKIIDTAHNHNIPVLIDGAQSVQHIPIDVQALDCDFFVFSGHKIYGPTGIGILYGKEKWLNEMPPYQGGGDMVDCVTFEKTTYNDLPLKFEAGTTNFIGAIGLAEAIRYLTRIGLDKVGKYENQLLAYAKEKLSSFERIQFYGTAPKKGPVISFLIDGIHPYDTGMVLDKLGIAVRTGTHCAQPLMDFFDIDGTVRVSLSFYNTFEEIDRLTQGIKKVIDMFG